MFAIGHTAYWVNFGSSHQKARRGWIAEAKDMIHAASELKIGLLNFHFYSKFGRVGADDESRSIFLENFIGAMKELTRFAGGEKVVLMLENTPASEKYPLGSIQYFAEIMNAIPALRFHLDIGHAFIENGIKGVRDYIDAFGDRLAHVHIHDNHGKDDEHLPLGRGKIDFRKVAGLLKAINYDKTITLEVFPSRADAVRSRALFNGTRFDCKG
jgi:sugar phosphate isomerase/epimerase